MDSGPLCEMMCQVSIYALTDVTLFHSRHWVFDWVLGVNQVDDLRWLL